MSDFKVVLPRTTEEWQRDMSLVYNKAIDDVLEKLYKYYHDVSNGKKYAQYDHYCNGVDYCIDIVEQLKVVANNENIFKS